jgi:hypothetical protein
MPTFAHLGLLPRLTGLLYVPITPLFPLPAKFRIRFLPPVATDEMGDDAWEDTALVQTVADEIRATIQSELLEMVGARKSIWFG